VASGGLGLLWSCHCPPGGMVDAADLKSAACLAWGFESPGGHADIKHSHRCCHVQGGRSGLPGAVQALPRDKGQLIPPRNTLSRLRLNRCTLTRRPIGRTGKREGSTLRTRQRLCPWTPAKVVDLCNLSIGYGMRGGPTVDYQGLCRPPSHPIAKMHGSKGHCPWWRFRRRSLLVGVRGGSPSACRFARLPCTHPAVHWRGPRLCHTVSAPHKVRVAAIQSAGGRSGRQ
jgi:hypothetical protein